MGTWRKRQLYALATKAAATGAFKSENRGRYSQIKASDVLKRGLKREAYSLTYVLMRESV